MKLVKRCNDNVIALLIILPALTAVRFAFQKVQFVILSRPPQEELQKYQECTEGPSTPKGEVTSFAAAEKKS
jgi:hypothetical protein